jgi:hypothetical protein
MSKPAPSSPRENPTPWEGLLFLGLAILTAWHFLAAEMIPAMDDNPSVSRGLFLLVSLTLPDEIFRGWVAHGKMPVGVWDRIPVLLAVGLWIVVAIWLGLWLLRRLRLAAEFHRLERGGLGLLLGWNLLSSLTFLVGVAGGLQLPWLIPLAVCCMIALGVLVERRSKDQASTQETASPSPSEPHHGVPTWSYWERRASFLLGWGLLFVVIMTLAGAIMPPIEFDVREYHLQAPKEFHRAGWIGFVPHNIYANMPMGTEMHALAWMSICPAADGWYWGGLIGKGAMACLPLATALILGGMLTRLAGPMAGWTAAIAYMANPGVAEITQLGLVDAALAAHVAGILCVLNRWHQRHGADGSGGRWCLLLGGLLGGAMACKYTAVPMIVLPSIVWAATLLGRGGNARSCFHYATLLAVAALVLGGHWYVKNALVAGNPVYPLMFGVFGGRQLSPERAQQWQRAHRVPPMASQSGDANAPPDFRVETWIAGLDRVGFGSPYAGLIAAPLMALACWAMVRAIPSVASNGPPVLAWLVWMYLVWFCGTHRLDRFWVPALPLTAFFAGLGATAIARARWSRACLWGWLCLGLLYAVVTVAGSLQSDKRYLVKLDALRYDLRAGDDLDGPGGRDTIWSRRVPVYQRWLNDHIQKHERVLIVGDAQVFDLEPSIFYSTCFDPTLMETWTRDKSADQQRAALAQHGVTHVVVHWAEIERYRSPGNYGFTDYITHALLQSMVEHGVLEPVQWPVEATVAQLYRVR